MTLQEKKQIKNFLQQGELDKIFLYFNTLNLSTDQQQIIIGLNTRYSDLKEKDMGGRISSDDFRTQRNILVHDILIFLDKQEETPSPIAPIIEEPTKTISFWKSKEGIIVKWLGGIGSIASIIGLIVYFFPTEPNFTQLTIFVVDKNNNPVLQNKAVISVPIKNEMKPKTLNNEGRVNFDEVVLQKGDLVKIGFKSDGWEIIGGQTEFKFEGKAITLQVQRAIKTRIIKGIVENNERKGLDKVKIIVNNDVVIYTNKNGLYQDTLPERLSLVQDSSAYTLKFIKAGYETKTLKSPANPSNFEVSLDVEK